MMKEALILYREAGREEVHPPMNGDRQNANLADRAEAILRSDRQALRRTPRHPVQPGILLVLVPENGAVIDLMDAYIPDIADATGLQYLRMVCANLSSIPTPYEERTALLLADLTGQHEAVINLVYQALGAGKRILLCAQATDDIPQDLAALPCVTYRLEQGGFDRLLREVMDRASIALEHRVSMG